MKNLDYIRDFPGGPMVKTPPSSACGGGLFGKLWSHMPWGVAKVFFFKKRKKKNPAYINYLKPKSQIKFRKMVTITLYARQQKRHRCIEQSFGLSGRGRGWDDLGEWHWNMYIIICETNRQSRFDTWYRVLRAGALGWPRGMGWGGRWERGSGWGTHVHPWRIHVNVWQNQYNVVK